MMEERTLPIGLIQPQSPWNVGAILEPLFSNLNYLLAPVKLKRGRDKIFPNNNNLWKAVLEDKLRAHMVIKLERFHLFEWFPRAPGLYYTRDAQWARSEALRFIDGRFPSAPINPRIDHARELVQRSKSLKAIGDHTLVFAPEGKLSMLQGGVGCVRLKPIQREGQVFWLMSASSSGVAHEGFPLAVPQELYETYLDDIIGRGSVISTITGELKFLPQPFSGLFSNFAGAPQLYLEVLDISPEPMRKQRDSSGTEVSVAVSFVSNYQRRSGIYASYVTFKPGKRSSFEEAISWLKNKYIEEAYQGRIITDFDQTKIHFPEAALSLRKVMGRHLSKGEVSDVIELMHARADVNRLFNILDLEDVKEGQSGVARTKVFISYSHTDAKWLKRVQVHLKPLAREHNLEVWDDTKIKAGSIWKEELENTIESAKVAILLISADFLSSDFIAEYELPRLLAAAKSRGTIILPVILSPSRYSEDPELSRFQAVNNPMRPIIRLPESKREQVFVDLGKAVQQALNGCGATLE